MAFGTPRVPSAYPALDSAAITRSGGPALDALITDTIEGAHNRLQAVGAHMFCLMAPIRAVTYGDTTEPSYSQTAGLGWAQCLSPFRHRKKPGHRAADYRARVLAPSGVDFELQVVTSAAPLLQRIDTSLAQIVRATGTGSRQTVSISGVPVDPGIFEASALYLRSDDIGAEHTAGTYGTPVSGTGVGLPRGRTLTLEDADPASWALTGTSAPNDYGSRGYFVQFSDSNGDLLATLRLVSVFGDASLSPAFVWADFADPIPEAFGRHLARSGSTTSWKLYEPVRVAFAAFSGATADRSP